MMSPTFECWRRGFCSCEGIGFRIWSTASVVTGVDTELIASHLGQSIDLVCHGLTFVHFQEAVEIKVNICYLDCDETSEHQIPLELACLIYQDFK